MEVLAAAFSGATSMHILHARHPAFGSETHFAGGLFHPCRRRRADGPLPKCGQAWAERSGAARPQFVWQVRSLFAELRRSVCLQ